MNRSVVARMSDHDRQAAVGLEKGSSPGNCNTAYKENVVFKPWGYEFLLGQSSCVAAWCLRINEGHQTSMHCHPRKDTVLLVLDGNGEVATLVERYEVSSGSVIFLESGVFHQTSAYSDRLLLCEFESPVDKYDLLRLQDAYGRKDKGYEKIVTERDQEFVGSHPRTPFVDFDAVSDSGVTLSFSALGIPAKLSLTWVNVGSEKADQFNHHRLSLDHAVSIERSIFANHEFEMKSKFLIWEYCVD